VARTLNAGAVRKKLGQIGVLYRQKEKRERKNEGKESLYIRVSTILGRRRRKKIILHTGF